MHSQSISFKGSVTNRTFSTFKNDKTRFSGKSSLAAKFKDTFMNSKITTVDPNAPKSSWFKRTFLETTITPVDPNKKSSWFTRNFLEYRITPVNKK